MNDLRIPTVGTHPRARGRAARSVGFVAAATGVVLLLHLAAPVLVAPRFWGLRTWEGVPFGVRALLFVIGASLLLPSRSRAFDALWHRPRASRKACIVALAIAAVFLFVLRTKVQWGNPDIAIEDAFKLRVTLKHTLATALSAVLRLLLGAQSAREAVALASVLSGVLYFWGSFAFGAALFPTSRVKARVVALSLATAGLSQQFFGVIESYPLSAATQVWVLTCIARLARPKAEGGSDSATPAVLAQSVAASTFVATLFLGPATLIAILRERSRGILRPISKLWLPLLAAVVPIGAALGLIHLLGVLGIGYRWPILIETFGGHGSAFVPLVWHGEETGYFSLLSWDHLACRANAVFLSVPAWLSALAAVASVEPEQPADPVARRGLLPLLLGALGSLSYLVLINPDLGPTIDWMETAAGAIAPFAFLLAAALLRASDATAARLGTLFVSLSVLHTLPWVLANAGLTGGAR